MGKCFSKDNLEVSSSMFLSFRRNFPFCININDELVKKFVCGNTTYTLQSEIRNFGVTHV